jgi:aminoglycoside phosphotransferase (APT) family kinase protein
MLRVLVHGDYFPGNVMIGEDDTVSGVIDFGALTVIGDPIMDIASAVIFLEATREAYDPADVGYLTRRLIDQRGETVIDALRTYRGFYAIRLSNSRSQDQHLYGWCVQALAGLAET